MEQKSTLCNLIIGEENGSVQKQQLPWMPRIEADIDIGHLDIAVSKPDYNYQYFENGYNQCHIWILKGLKVNWDPAPGAVLKNCLFPNIGLISLSYKDFMCVVSLI